MSKYALIDHDNAYYQMIHSTWGERLRQVFTEIPDPQWTTAPHAVPGSERSFKVEAPPRADMPIAGDIELVPTPSQTLAQEAPASREG
ncbi:Uncharacterised protein [Mycobacteroides abscessus subsp. abscessus]|nr:Uncharacterised protein [Mycobacteroides abscessus subsp. abscessus]